MNNNNNNSNTKEKNNATSMCLINMRKILIIQYTKEYRCIK